MAKILDLFKNTNFLSAIKDTNVQELLKSGNTLGILQDPSFKATIEDSNFKNVMQDQAARVVLQDPKALEILKKDGLLEGITAGGSAFDSLLQSLKEANNTEEGKAELIKMQTLISAITKKHNFEAALVAIDDPNNTDDNDNSFIIKELIAGDSANLCSYSDDYKNLEFWESPDLKNKFFQGSACDLILDPQVQEVN